MNHELITSEAVSLDLRPASVMSRLVAGIVDTLIYLLVTLGLLLALSTALPNMDMALIIAMIMATAIFGIVIVPITVDTATRGRSLGNMMMGMRIVRFDGGAIRFRHALIRGLVAVLEIYLTLGALAVVTSALSPRAQRIGDLLAGTVAIRVRLRKTVPFQPQVAPQLAGWARSVDLGQLPDSLARRITLLLNQAPAMFAPAVETMSRELLTEALAFIAPRPPQTAHPIDVLTALMSTRYERSLTALTARRERIASQSHQVETLPFEGAIDR